jgi:hypothetical protein
MVETSGEVSGMKFTPEVRLTVRGENHLQVNAHTGDP